MSSLVAVCDSDLIVDAAAVDLLGNDACPQAGLQAALCPLFRRFHGQPHVGHLLESLGIAIAFGRRVLVRSVGAVPLLVTYVAAEDALARPTLELVRPTGRLWWDRNFQLFHRLFICVDFSAGKRVDREKFYSAQANTARSRKLKCSEIQNLLKLCGVELCAG